MNSSVGTGSDSEPVSQAGGAQGSTLAIAFGLFVAALGVRLLPWRSVFQPDAIVPFGGDAYYHLHRIRDTVEHFPSILHFDPMINFPDGGQPIWPPTFDWLLAAVMRLFVGPGRPEALETAIMWMAPVLGALTVVVVYFLGRRFFSPAIGGLAALLLVFLPAHFNYSQLGFADHHVAVSLLATGVLWLGMALFAAPPDRSPDRRGARLAASLGLGVGGLLLVWPGALIHVAIIQIALVVRLLVTREAWQALCWARRFALLHVVAFCVVLPLCVGQDWVRWGRFSPVVLSNFQPLYLGAAALAFLLCAQIWPRVRWGERAWSRALSAALIGSGLVSLLFAAIPELHSGAGESWTWFSRSEVFQVTVGESVPLFRHGPVLDWQLPAMLFGASIYVVPIAWLILARNVRARADRAFLLWWTAAFFVATLYQRRFMNTYSIAHVLVFAWFVGFCFERAANRFAHGARTRRGLAIATALLLLALMWPIHERYELDLRDLARAAHGEHPPLRGLARQLRPIFDTALWLRANSPEPSGLGYSVLGPWDVGHLIQYEAARSVVQDNFGDDVGEANFNRAELYFATTDEAQAIDLVASARVRYVLARATGSGHAVFRYAPESMASRLFLARGSRGRVEAVGSHEPTTVDALARHRLVYESRPLSDADADAATQGRTPFVKLFEIVPGAHVIGRAPAGAVVELHLDLQSRNGGGFAYETSARADAEGRYAVVLPYPNEPFSPDIRMAPHWTATLGNEKASFRVPEAAVASGGRVEGPDFEARPAPSGSSSPRAGPLG